MERNTKETIVSEVKERFDRMTSAVFLSYEGMDVESVNDLRSEFRNSDVEYKVVKNTLLKLALAGSPYGEAVTNELKGMTSVAWSYEDPSAAAKVVKKFRKGNEKLQVKLGVIDGQVLSADAVENQLATMPGKDELRAMLLATMAAPSTQFVQQLNAAAQNFVYLLKAKEDK